MTNTDIQLQVIDCGRKKFYSTGLVVNFEDTKNNNFCNIPVPGMEAFGGKN